MPWLWVNPVLYFPTEHEQSRLRDMVNRPSLEAGAMTHTQITTSMEPGATGNLVLLVSGDCYFPELGDFSKPGEYVFPTEALEPAAG